MALTNLSNSVLLYDIAREYWWRYTLPTISVEKLSWTLPVKHLQQAQLIWPRTYRWAPAAKWLEQIRLGLERHVQLTRTDDIEQPQEHAVAISLFKIHGKEHFVAFDYSDYPEIQIDIAQQCLCYFKLQHRKDGYEHPAVLPGGYLVNDSSIYQYATHFRLLQQRPHFDLYGRFSLDFATDIRRTALNLLQQQQTFAFEGSPKRVRYSRFLEEASLSRLVLDLPGNGDFCFRLIDYFALGCAIIAPEHLNRLHVPLEEGRHVMYCRRDLSDLVATCETTLSNSKLLESLRSEARQYFDAYLHREQLAAYYLHSCVARM